MMERTSWRFPEAAASCFMGVPWKHKQQLNCSTKEKKSLTASLEVATMYLPGLWCPLSQAAGAHPWEWDVCSNQRPSRLLPCSLCPSASQRVDQWHEVGSPLSSSALPPFSGNRPEDPDDAVYLRGAAHVKLQSTTTASRFQIRAKEKQEPFHRTIFQIY